MKAMVPLKAISGRPPLTTKKQLVSVRYSPEVLAYFKSGGAGWQTRMDEALRQWVAVHTKVGERMPQQSRRPAR